MAYNLLYFSHQSITVYSRNLIIELKLKSKFLPKLWLDCTKYSKEYKDCRFKMNNFLKNNEKVQSIALLVITCLFLTLSNNILATATNNYESSENIRNTAKSFLEEMTSPADIMDTELNVGNIDPRLKLKKCHQPLVAYLPQGSKSVGKISIGVKCAGPIPWKVFISASNYRYQSVIYAKNTLRKGQLISKQDLGIKRVRLNNRHKQPAIDYQQVVMTSPRRFIRAGSVIFTDSVCMVCRGHKVNVSTGNEFFSINVEAEALADASVGESVRLRNGSSRRIFNGMVVGRNKAQVTLLR